MRVVVIGGQGYLGSRALAALGRTDLAGTLQIQSASRRGPLRVDLEDPSTFEALRGADVVLDLADTTTRAPDALAKFCLANGIVLVEGSSDPEAVKRLASLRGAREGTGAIVLGAGVFTGVSNLLARKASRDLGEAPAELTLGISTSPYSGAGSGTIALMVAMLARKSARWIAGARHEGPLARGPNVLFPSGLRPTIRAAFPEQDMIGPSTGAANADVLFAPVPGVLVTAFMMLPAWLLTTRALAWTMNVYFTVLRAWLLRALATRLEMGAEARTASGRSSRVTAVTADGMEAGGAAAAAIVTALLAQSPRPRGVFFVDDLVELEDIVRRANAITSERGRLALA